MEPRECCSTPPEGEHFVTCPNWEPALTVEEIRHLRETVLKGVKSS